MYNTEVRIGKKYFLKDFKVFKSYDNHSYLQTVINDRKFDLVISLNT
jgi:hypothetical protein